MTEVGAAYSSFELRYDGLRKGVEQSIALLERLEKRALEFEKRIQGISLAPGGGRSGGGGSSVAAQNNAAIRASEQIERQYQRQQAALVRLRQAEGDYAGALRIIRAEINASIPGSERQLNLLRQEIQLREKAAASARQQGGGFGEQFGQGIAGGLPFGLGAGGGFAAAQFLQSGLGSAFQGIKSSFNLAAELDDNRRSLGAFLGSMDQGNATFQAAERFARRYGFTMEEISNTLRDAAPVFKASTQPIERQLEVLSRLGQRNRSEGVGGAAFALNEIVAGDVTSLKERFNISGQAARALRDEIKAGADPIVALDGLLNELGLTAEGLEQRLEGPGGAIRRWEKAQEDLSISMSKLIAGPGADFLTWLSNVAVGAGSAVDKINQMTGGGGGIGASIRATLQTNPLTALPLAALDKLASLGQEAAESQRNLDTSMSFSTGAVNALGNALNQTTQSMQQFNAAAATAAAQSLTAIYERQKQVDRQLSDLDQQHAQRQAGFARQAGEAWQSYLSNRDRAQRDFARTQARAARDFAIQQGRAQRDFAQQEAQAATEHSRRLVDIRADAARDIERLEKEHRQRLQSLQRDFDIESSRAREDFDEERRRLLAEGRVAEARRLTTQFEKEQRRRGEDLARSKSGETDQFGEKVTDRKGQTEEQIGQEQAQFERQRAQRRQAFAQQQADAAAAYAQQRQDAQQAFAQQQADQEQAARQQQGAIARQQQEEQQSYRQSRARILADFESFKVQQLEQYNELIEKTKLTAANMAKGMSPEEAAAKAELQIALRKWGTTLETFSRDLEKGGGKAGSAWVRAFLGEIATAPKRIEDKYIDLKDRMIGQSPPPKGPLRGLDKGGENIGRAWREGLLRGIGGNIDPSLSMLRQSLGAGAGGVAALERGSGAAGRGAPGQAHATVVIPAREVTLDGERIGLIAEERIAVAFQLFAAATEQIITTATPGTGQQEIRGLR